MLNMTQVAQALKLWYLDPLRYQLNEATSDFLNMLERDTQNVRGSRIVMPLRYGRSGGVGNRADDGTLPTPSPRLTRQAEWETRNIFARMQITDKAIEASRGNAAAFAPMLDTTLDDLQNDAKFSLSRQAWGDGVGIIATVSAVAANVLTVPAGTIWLFAEGMLLDAFQGAGATIRRAGMVVTAVDDVANTVTVDNAATVVANDTLTIAGSRGQELTGMAAVAAQTGTIYGLARATFPFLRMTSLAVNGEISEILIQRAIDAARRKTGAKTNFIVCSQGVKRAYQNLLMAQKQIVNTVDLKGGSKAISFNGIPLVDDLFAPAGQLYALDTNDWKMYQMSDWEWLDRDGNILTRVAGVAAWEATLRKYCDIGCSRLGGQTVLTGITEH